MKKNNAVKLSPVFFVFGVCFLILPFFSCASQINGIINADNSAVLSVNSGLQPRITVMIAAMASASGQNSGTVINGAAISAALNNTRGIATAALVNTSPSSVEGLVIASNINEFLSLANGRNIIVFDQAQKRCQININYENGPQMLTLLSPDITNYLNALMAPVATGEDMSKQDYLALIEMFYNKAVSDEIAFSEIHVSIEFPGTVTEARGGTFSGRQAVFDIPLVDLLVLETPLIYEVRWN